MSIDTLQAVGFRFLDLIKETIMHPGKPLGEPGVWMVDNVGPCFHDIITEILLLPEWTYHLFVMFVLCNLMAAFVSVTGFWLIYMERKVCAWFQNRIGPNRVGWRGSLQTIADALKLVQKEDLIPDKADRAVFMLAPFVAVTPTYAMLALLPYDHLLWVSNPELGVLIVMALAALAPLSILMAGWSSANKYSLLGGLRSAAQIISYELSPALVVLSVVLFAGGTLSMRGMVEAQAENWNLWGMGPFGVIGALIFLIGSTAEINRAPFDLPEAESELTAGYSTEYSGMRFSMFGLAEFMNMFVVSALLATYFLGGYLPLTIAGESYNPCLFGMCVPGYVWFMLKTYAVIFVLMWFRWTFPRVRVDQLMRLEWKILLPIAFINLFLVAGWTLWIK